MENILERVFILMQSQRFQEAEGVLKTGLSSQPDNEQLLALFAEVNIRLANYDVAREAIDNAIGLNPQWPHLFYIKAQVAVLQDDYKLGEECLQMAVSLDPEDADYLSYWALIKLDLKQYEAALELANRSLALDAENLLGMNSRSTALLKLGYKEDSFNTIEGALREDPNNSYTHANYGWGLLEKGNSKKALEHFREALRSNPSNMNAQAGMVEALKANNIFYRYFLKYTFWIGNLTKKYQWGVVLGFYFGMKGLRLLAEKNPPLQPYLTPLIILLSIVAFSTWIITPVSNLFLRLNSYGRHLLDKKEIQSSNFVGISFLVFIAGGIAYFSTAQEPFLGVTVFGFAMMLPFGAMFAPSKYKNAMVIYAAGMAVVGILSIVTSFSTGELYNLFTTIFVFSFIAFQFIANSLIIGRGKA